MNINDTLIYIYAKDDYKAKNDLDTIKIICDNHGINVLKVYSDITTSNKLDLKVNLKKLINENKDCNLLVFSVNKLGRDLNELLEIREMLQEKNIKVYDAIQKELIFNDMFSYIKEMQENILDKGSDKDLQRNLNVLVVEPNKLPVKKTIKNTLEEKQKLVGGLIEYTYIENCNDITIICNEEGKILGLPLNRDIGHDIIAGNFLIVGDDPELGEDRSLTDEQIEKYTKYFGKESIENTNKKIDRLFWGIDL